MFDKPAGFATTRCVAELAARSCSSEYGQPATKTLSPHLTPTSLGAACWCWKWFLAPLSFIQSFIATRRGANSISPLRSSHLPAFIPCTSSAWLFVHRTSGFCSPRFQLLQTCRELIRQVSRLEKLQSGSTAGPPRVAHASLQISCRY